MGTVEKPSSVPESAGIVLGSEPEKEFSEVLGDGPCGVPQNEVVCDQGSGDDGVIPVDNSSVFETVVSILKENDHEVAVGSEVSGDAEVVDTGVLESEVSVPRENDREVVAGSEVDEIVELVDIGVFGDEVSVLMENYREVVAGSEVDEVVDNSVLQTEVLIQKESDCEVVAGSEMNVVAEVVTTSVLESEVSLMKENDCEVVAGSEMNVVADVVTTSVLESEVPVLKENDCEVVAGSEVSSVAEVVTTGVLETKVSVLKENDCEVVTVCDMNGVSSLVEMGESGMKEVFSIDASESRGAEADALNMDAKNSEEGEKNEDIDGKVVTIEVPISETSEDMNGASPLLKMGESGVKEVSSSDDVPEKLETAHACESGGAEADISNVDAKNSKEGEKDEDINGKVVTIEVPISETSEDMDRASPMLKMGDSGVKEVSPSDDGPEKLEIVHACESGGAEADVLTVDEKKSDAEEKGEDCDWKFVTIEVPIAEIGEDVDVEMKDVTIDVLTVDEKKSDEEEKGEDCDGKFVTSEVPIAGTDEDVDVEMKDLTDEEGCAFSVGDFVWGKIKSHPWWPGRVYDPSDASDLALKLKRENTLLVAHFGDAAFAWCHPSQLKPFEENFDDMVKISSSVGFINAVQEAAIEFGRLLEMKMCHSFVVKEIIPGKNSGIREGVCVPVPFKPAELLSRVKLIAATVDVDSILELEKIKAQLSAFYLSRGGYKLPRYQDPQPIPGLEDRNSSVLVPVEMPSVEEYSTLQVNPKFGELCHSTGLSGNKSKHSKKKKSIAEIMGDDIDVSEEDATEEMVDGKGLKGRKKRKGSEDVLKKKELLLDTDSNVSSAENDGDGSKTGTDEVKSEEPNERGTSRRERKKSKYLSPPYTTIKGLWKEMIVTESLEAPGEARGIEGTARSAGQSNGKEFQENFSEGVCVKQELSNSSDNQTQEVDDKRTIDPKIVQASSRQVLSEVLYAAINPQGSTSLDKSVDFVSVFRSSIYRGGSLHKFYEKLQPGRKRKKQEFELEMLKKDQDQYVHASAKKSKKGNGENAPGAVLLVEFWPGSSSMPSKSDLITVFSKFGALNEAETDMFCANHTAQVSFLRTCDAEKAFSHSENPFESSEVSFQIKYLSDGSMSKPSDRKKSKSPVAPSVSVPVSGEASKLNFIKEKLQVLNSIVEASDGESADLKTKIESKMKSLLEDVDKMIESSSS